jgi:hypothetical protein
MSQAKWIFFIALVPEMTATSSIQQYVFVASKIREVGSVPQFSNDADKWTLMDGFYANMGGLVLFFRFPAAQMAL